MSELTVVGEQKRIIRTPDQHARAVIRRMAFRDFDSTPLAARSPFEEYVRYYTALYYDLERKGLLKPEPPDEAARDARAEENFANLGKNLKEAKGTISLKGKKAKEFDDIFQGAKQQAKARTPLVTSIPGRAAKRALIHE